MTRPSNISHSALSASSVVLAHVCLSALIVCVGCTSDDSGSEVDPVDDSEPTFWLDVAPILSEHCSHCHLSGPSTYRPLFNSFEAIKSVAGTISIAVEDREMPPFAAVGNDSCHEFQAPGPMTDSEIAIVKAWATGKRLEGPKPVDATLVSDRVTTQILPSVSLTMAEPYRPVAPDGLNRCFVLDGSLDSLTRVTGVRVTSTAPQIVQQVSLHAINEAQVLVVDELNEASLEPGYPCFGGIGVEDSRLIAPWNWGYGDFVLPNQVGIEVGPNDRFVVEVSFSINGGGLNLDEEEIEVELELDEDVPGARFERLSLSDFVLSAGNPTEIVSGLERLEASSLHGFVPFMHTLGRQQFIQRLGQERCLADIPHWDAYNHRRLHTFETEVDISSDGSFWLECHYDTTSRETPVSVGTTFNDEQCGAFMLVGGSSQ